MQDTYNREELLNRIANSNIIPDTIGKYTTFFHINLDRSILDDLAQDIFLSVATKPDEKLRKLTDDGALGFYIYKTVANNLSSKTSPFYRTYRKPLIDMENNSKRMLRHYNEQEALKNLMYDEEDGED